MQEEQKDALSDEMVLSEILRRVKVFSDALECSGSVYDAFDGAYRNTIHFLENDKKAYLQGIAQGFISLLLFGSDDHKLDSSEDIEYIHLRLEKLFEGIEFVQANEIKKLLIQMMNKGYPHLHINRLGLLNEIQTPLTTIFDILDCVRE